MSEATIDVLRIFPAWTGAPTNVFLRVFNNDAAFAGRDGIAVCRTTTSCTAVGFGADNILGTVDLGATPFVTTTSTYVGTISWDPAARVFTVVFGGCASPPCSPRRVVTPSTATFRPINGATQVGGIRDTAGNGVTGTAIEVGLHF